MKTLKLQKYFCRSVLAKIKAFLYRYLKIDISDEQDENLAD